MSTRAIVCAIGLLFSLAACSSDGKDGASGPAGTTALTKLSPEAAGMNCPSGGTKVEVGLDKNNNGILDPDEVTQTNYVCSGGSGDKSLVKTTPEPGGTNCQWGGVRIDTGIDKNNNGMLDADEIDPNGTTYVCNMSASGTIAVTEGMVANIKAGGVSTKSPITVRFTLKDKYGYPVDINGKYSINAAIQPRFSLAYYTKDSNGNVLPFKVYTKTMSLQSDGGAAPPQPSNYNPLGTTPGQGTLTENGMGAGDYTYTFPTADTQPTQTLTGSLGVNYDQSKMTENHVVWIQVSRQTDLQYQTNGNTYYTHNYPFYFIPAGGNATAREIVNNANCQKCHDNFRLETTTLVGIHGGGRNNANFCSNCHNPDRWSNPQAEAKSFIHRIHNGEKVAPANLFHGIEATYPQDTRKCDVCHGGAAQGAQAQNVPSRLACGGCHDYVSFTLSASTSCASPTKIDPDGGLPQVCNHLGGSQSDDTKCAGCHNASDIDKYHYPVIRPDPANSRLDGGTNSNTNAAYAAVGGFQVPNAAKITYIIGSVDTWSDNGTKRPMITFKFQNNGQDVVFNTPVQNQVVELMNNFVGSPSVQFAWAVPQDGITKPADFNASASVYIKNALNGLNGATMTGPDNNGFYTIKSTTTIIASNATMLTGGIGYSYSLSSTQPLTETDLSAYPYVAGPDSNNGGATMQGGLLMTPPNVWAVAKGFTGRRPIVDTNQCKNCHGALGISPTFHAGQRNDGPTCSFCHNPNRTSSGWAAGSKYHVHAIHAGRKRDVPFTWHAPDQTRNYDEIGFPSALNDCKVCHLPNTYDFTAPLSLAAVDFMPLQAAATGKFDGNSPTAYQISPYVVKDNTTDYGAGFSYNATTGVTTAASGNNAVISPIMTACVACHDKASAVSHMKANGGAFYDTRSNNLGVSKEQCLICHGPGRIAAIGEVHLK